MKTILSTLPARFLRHARSALRREIAGWLGLLMLGTAGGLTASAVPVNFGAGANQFTLEFVPIGNPGNPGRPTGQYAAFGAVPYVYSIAKYEISRDIFIKANANGNLGIPVYPQEPLGTTRLTGPMTRVTWNGAARFVNWLNTSQGFPPAYQFATQPGDANYDANSNLLLWAPGDAGYDESNPFRNTQARYFLPTHDEGTKAAFHDPNGIGGTVPGYWDFSVGSDAYPIPVASGTAAGTIVYEQDFLQGPADVDQAGGLSPYGVMGLCGNVWEWLETEWNSFVPRYLNSNPAGLRGLLGGPWWTTGGVSWYPGLGTPTLTELYFGFRVVSVISVPRHVVITPTDVKSTSQWTNTGDGNVRHLIDGSGLSGTGSVLTQTHDASANAATMWHAGPNNGGLGGPVGNPPAVNTQRLEFDLGANYDLDVSYFWNLNQAGNTGRGVKVFTLQMSSSTTGAFTAIGNFELPQGTGTAGLGAHAVVWAMRDIRRVRVVIQSAWSDLANDYVGLSEVRFLGSLTPDKGANTGTIPDNHPAGRDITFNVANRTGVVTEVTVEVTMDHPSTSNVVLQLIAPDGTIETLLYTTVRGADLNGTYIFKDNATAYLSAVSQNLGVSDIVPFGSYHPENTLTSTGAPTPTSLVGAFGGKAPNGTWKLRAIDRAAGNVGSVSSARLTLFTERRERITITPGAGDSRVVTLTGGVPASLCDVQRSPDLTSWTRLDTLTLSPTGTVTFTDTAPPAGKAFYRWAVP